ncbi:MAG TPA: DUF1697 domain-containing protein [Herpetosiphonaceae bacterium]
MATLHGYIAFLRAINVGGHNVKMAQLRSLFEELSFAEVATFIASGNVFFKAESGDVPGLEAQIERHLKAALGYEVATFIRTPAELAAVAAYQPFPESDLAATDAALSIAFLRDTPTQAAQKKLLDLRNEIDDFRFHERELYWLRRTRISESTFSGALMEKTLAMPATMRNVTTVRKLAAKYPPE